MNLFNNLTGKQHGGYSRLQNGGKATAAFKTAADCSTFLLLFTVLIFCVLKFLFGDIKYVLVPFLLIFFLGLLYKLQDRLLYHPEMPANSSLYVPFPSHLPHEILRLKTEDGEGLHGYFIKKQENGSTSPTVLYFHGNAGNAGSPCTLPLNTICGCNVLVVDYRGYGKSTGCPSEEGLYIDGKTCIEYLRTRSDVDPNKIILFGHSMGGAIAIHLAAMAHGEEYRIAALIVENTFTSIPDAAQHVFRGILPGISKLPIVCYKNKFMSIDKIAKVNVPILFICGDKDEILDPNMTRILRNASDNSHTIFVRVPKGSHNDTWCVSHSYYKCVSAFLAKVFNEDIVLQNRSTEQASMEDILIDKPTSELVLTWKSEIIAT
uniref:protein ABHD13-like n=1 Tax=Styela clava TaxID=7725 RepID=UPI001939E812|nr:protein ABHD13-like [Styela clava]